LHTADCRKRNGVNGAVHVERVGGSCRSDADVAGMILKKRTEFRISRPNSDALLSPVEDEKWNRGESRRDPSTSDPDDIAAKDLNP
jgi:hypothetical protein